MSVPPDGVPPSVGEPREAPQPQTDLVEDADVHAFLIADVRGYTAFTQERGDEEGAHLAARFASVVRALVEDHRGRVIELRGDEALVVFGSPRSAIRGAVALQQRFVEETIADPSFPLTVGIGLDAGEAVPVEGGFRGAALNVAGRLCSLAKAGEVLASREIVHLARRLDGVRFIERGQAQLKGIQQPVHIVAVRSEDRDAAEAIAPFVRSTATPPPPHRRWKVVAAAVAFAVLAALVAVPLIARGSSEIAPNSIGVLDAESGELTATVGLAQRPGSVAATAEAVWVTHPDFGTVTRIDPNDQEIRDTIPVGENPTGIAVGEDAVWVVESGGPTLSRISPETSTVVGDPIEVGNGPADVAVGEGSVWVTNRFDGTISRIDPDRGEVVETIPVGIDPRGIAIGFGSVWVTLSGSNRVVRVDPETNAVTQTIGVGNAPGSLAVSGDAVWVAITPDDTVWRINPDTASVENAVPVGDSPTSIAVVDGTLWVANEADGTLSRIEPGETSARTIVVGSVPQGLAGLNGDLWVSVRGTAIPHQGGTLRVVSIGPTSSLDSAVAYEDVAWSFLHLMGDGLVAFEPIGGTNPTLVPDLATSVPTPSDGGRTYRFELRSGVQYSNGEVVAPADFRRAIERVFHLESGGIPFFTGLVGGKACVSEPRTCDLSRGIETDDVTITFHLLEPDPEFLVKLTLTFAHPVPPSTPDEEQVTAGIPGTGPYMLEEPMTDERLALVRNRHFHVWSQAAQPDGYVDRIEWTFPVKPRAQVEAVRTGEADVTFGPSGSDGLEEIFVQFPAQVHSNPVAALLFLVLDTDAPPFDDVEVRRAMNLALDRDRIVQIFGGQGAAVPTCQQLPPNFPGYEPYCPYTMDPAPAGEGSWNAPDLDEAKRIVRRSGTRGMRVTFEYPQVYWDDAGGQLLGKYMIELLDELGYRGEVRPLSIEEFFSPRNEFHMALLGWGLDYPAASTFISPFLTCSASQHPRSGFCDREIDVMIERATQMQVEDPVASGALWAEIDRKIVDQAPHLWLVNPIDVKFVSERVGNYQYGLQWGVLFNQLWVQ